MTTQTDSLNDLLDFLQQSPTPFHAVAVMRQRLLDAGFRALDPKQDWDLRDGHGYFVERNGSSIVAFRTPEDPGSHRVHMIGAHTDSLVYELNPMLKLINKVISSWELKFMVAPCYIHGLIVTCLWLGV